MKMKVRNSVFWIVMACVFMLGCEHRGGDAVQLVPTESKQAKAMLQGIWVDAETEEVVFRAKGDTLYFPDSMSVQAYFQVVNDSLHYSNQSYAIVKQAAHLFWFKNNSGDVIKLKKSDNPNDALDFLHEAPKAMAMVSELKKTDSIVFYERERYHWYIAVNPTRYKVTKTSYTADGIGVENVYYDNIIHISIYKGADKLFSSDFKKQMYANLVPSEFLSQALLGNMHFDSVDQRGFHFKATLCIPDGATCYLVSTDISFDGRLSMKLMEY
jgi:hypothetical protein